MSKKKKVLMIIYIAVAVTSIIACVGKIFAEAGIIEEEEEWISTAYGWYEVTEEDEEGVDDCSARIGTYKTYEEAEAGMKAGLYYDTKLCTNGSIFCIQQGQQLPSSTDKDKIRKLGSEGTGFLTDQGATILNETPADAESISEDEEKALESRVSLSDQKRGIKKDQYNYFANTYSADAEYYSRDFLRDDDGNVTGTVTTLATENVKAGTKWASTTVTGDGTYTTENDFSADGTIPWEDAYVLANADTSSSKEENEYQLALWGLQQLNTGGTAAKAGSEACYNEVYKKAKAFGEYKTELETRGEGPKLNTDSAQDYTYKFNVSGNYLIAGPINIDYGTLKDESTGLELRQIGEYKVYGEDINGSQIDITEYIEFTDSEGNALTDMETTSEGKSFPKSNTEFYIKIGYENPIYTQVKSIYGFEVSFKELDVRAVAYKISDVQVEWTEWDDTNIMYEKCILLHRYTVTTEIHVPGRSIF